MQTTGWPPGMLQDDSRELSRWLSTRLGAKHQLQRNNMQTNQNVSIAILLLETLIAGYAVSSIPPQKSELEAILKLLKGA